MRLLVEANQVKHTEATHAVDYMQFHSTPTPLRHLPRSIHTVLPRFSMTADTQATIEIRQYRPEDHAGVTKLFVEGLMVFDDNVELRYLWEERLRFDLTHDFADIEASHMAPGGNFWVAIATKDEVSTVVGMVGLQRRPEAVGELRRVFVDPKCQRLGIGRKMLTHLERWSKEHGIERLFLTTNAKKEQPQAFYASMGYTKVDETLYAWNKNPTYFELAKFIKQL